MMVENNEGERNLVQKQKLKQIKKKNQTQKGQEFIKQNYEEVERNRKRVKSEKSWGVRGGDPVT